MTERFITKWFWSGLGTNKTPNDSQRFVDCHDYSQRLQAVYNELDSIGYDVINVVPIVTGQSDQVFAAGGVYLGDIGFSITRGAVVVGQRRD